jgi:hypothetical protein
VDAIVYGDEPAAILTALELARQLRRQPPQRRTRLLLLTAADTRTGLGGTISRGGLAYLDRNQVPEDLSERLPLFAPSSDLYARFLRMAGVREIAVDPQRASQAFAAALRRSAIPVVDRVVLRRTIRTADRLCVVETNRGSFSADLFLDGSIAGELAHAAGVRFHSGLGGTRLAASSLSLGWIFTVEGLSLRQLQELEERLTRRLLNPRDRQAQQWLDLWPAYRSHRPLLRAALLDRSGRPRLIRSYSSDSADQQSPALSIAFHGSSHRPPGLERSDVLLDRANVALLPGRLSFNALLFRNSARQNRLVLAAHNQPLPWMAAPARDLEHFLLSHGARRVRWAPELYVRSADQIAQPLEPLTMETMALGGVPASQALGTFTYALDLRGGLPGIALAPMARPTFNFGYRHTLPRELRNLAVLGPAGGFGGLGEGAGRILELNVSVGQGLAIAAAQALQASGPQRGALDAVDPWQVAQRMQCLSPHGVTPYGRPTSGTVLEVLLRRLEDLIDLLPLPR